MSRHIERFTVALARPVRRLRSCRAVAASIAIAGSVALIGGVTAPALAQVAPAPAHARVAMHKVASGRMQAAAAAIRTARYWTRSRMLAARNADALSLPMGAAPVRPLPARPHPSGPPHRVPGVAPTQALKGGVHVPPALARPRSGLQAGPTGGRWTGNFWAPPATTTGKVFFTTTGNGQTENWACSGSTVAGSGGDLVLTAGHCVYGDLGGEVPGEAWHSNWIFVPDYYYGYAPYGVWTARVLTTTWNWYDNQDEGDDIGAVAVNTNSAGQHIVNVVGGQGIAWDFPDNQYVYDFGYPGAPPFDGGSLQECDSAQFDWSSVLAGTMGMTCNFTGGSSGGPWLMYFNGEVGYINGVNDFSYPFFLPGYMFSLYFGGNVGSFYNDIAYL